MLVRTLCSAYQAVDAASLLHGSISSCSASNALQPVRLWVAIATDHAACVVCCRLNSATWQTTWMSGSHLWALVASPSTCMLRPMRHKQCQHDPSCWTQHPPQLSTLTCHTGCGKCSSKRVRLHGCLVAGGQQNEGAVLSSCCSQLTTLDHCFQCIYHAYLRIYQTCLSRASMCKQCCYDAFGMQLVSCVN